ncbi:hypothetical protein [Mycobacteroides abscessus]|uniref:hypothetical protein n=1 Tax=Mycobacteroides abscessus TaxID=36809 RepID=UPI0002684125|nr:hypothetical protein [Mycobacteroides abscessus]EIV30537.1 hypothetical protein MA3A0119R_0181 [Mycobacteroides abscessus 3A-0119-R]EIV43673.1 hypothetical protein MA3A0731_0182 [Mycobacteroides abscessus 3A-0731]EIV58243.1 hypothetical protein MA3A0930S_0186 [Mycobacteroides abscessus 3A-0930-S]EIV62248.1 hypothetical protein MA3A0930R_0186 [Mycobacteroides abscessus 3A-0930-R]EIV84569.1 hypothetical protein MM3A0810R_0185 [Mycobacteroides abscessus 3A-0810-R]
MTGQQKIDRAALANGWVFNGGAGAADAHRECVYRLPGTPSWVSIMYAHTGVILWADGQDSRRIPRHFAGIDKVDRLVSFLAGS